MRIKAAVDARKESGSDIVIVARSDARQAVSFEESLWRTRAFADAGADVLFIDALTSREEMKAFCETAPSVPKLVRYMVRHHKVMDMHMLLAHQIIGEKDFSEGVRSIWNMNLLYSIHCSTIVKTCNHSY